MIRFSLRCAEGHRFDSWFASGDEYDRLSAGRLLNCAVCGTSEGVEKDLMAPGVRTAAEAAERPLSAPASPAEQALAELRRKIEANSEDVGRNFPAEARRIHAGESPDRPIIGEARVSEARALIEEGVPIAPLPWSRKKSN